MPPPPSPSPHGGGDGDGDDGGTRRRRRTRTNRKQHSPRPHYSYINKWVSFSASLTSLLGAGLSYAFALYAEDLKERFRFSQRQTDGVAAFMNLGGYLGVPAGLLYDALLRRGYRRAGPRVVMVLGALISAGGYLSLWRLEARAGTEGAGGGGASFAAPASGNGGVGGNPGGDPTAAAPPPFALVCLSAFAAANGASFLDCSALATAVRNHRGAQRGGAVGALKAAVGLSGSLFAAAFLASFSGDAPKFLLFLAAAPLALAVAASAFVNVVPFEQDDEVGVVSGGGSSGAAASAVPYSPTAAVATTTASSPSSSSSPFSFALLSPSARVAASSGVLLLLALYVTGATLVLRGPGGPAALTKEARACLSLGLAAVAAGLALLPSWGAGLWARRAPSIRGSGGGSAAGLEAENSNGAGAGGGGGEGGSCSECSESEEEGGFDDDGDDGDGDEEEGEGEEIERGEQPEPSQQQQQPLLPSISPHTTSPHHPHPPPVLRDPSFWLLFAACTSGAAAGLSFINNAAQIAASAGSPPEAAPVLVSAFSVANCVGRLAFGSLSERALHRSKGRLPRPLALAVAALMAAAASAALAVSKSAEPAPFPPPLPPSPSPTPTPSLSLPPPWPPLTSDVPSFSSSFSSSSNSSSSASASSLLLPAVAACAGAYFGGMWTLMAASTADLFGVRRYASTYALLQVRKKCFFCFEFSKLFFFFDLSLSFFFLQPALSLSLHTHTQKTTTPKFAPAVGSFAFARGLAGKLYDRAAAAQGLSPGAAAGCSGLNACFGETFKICALLCVAGALCSVLLAARTKGCYLELGRELAAGDEERERVLKAAAEAAAEAAARAASAVSAADRRRRHLFHHHPRSHALSERDSIF